MKKEMLELMKKTKMNQSTITGVIKLANTPERMKKVIRYIKHYQKIITDHQLRQYIAIMLSEELDKM